jgi:hypothetical protein
MIAIFSTNFEDKIDDFEASKRFFIKFFNNQSEAL